MEWQNNFNPFNSWKLMAHYERWKPLADRVANPPVLVTIDPVNACNLKCPHCNAAKVTGLKTKIPEYLNEPLAEFLHAWGVKAVCVAGGGEPLLHGSIIGSLADAGLQVGVVTNGTYIDNWLDTLSKCEWVGVSVDAATPMIFESVKQRDMFHQVIRNISRATEVVGVSNPTRGRGVFYKYLILPGNEHEIAAACKLAKELGCKGFHARPAGIPGTDVNMVRNMCDIAQSMATDEFGVYTVTHKVGADLDKKNDFKGCWGCMMTMVISPHVDGFNIDLCCDQRGDSRFRLAEGLTSPEEILDYWNTDAHWDIRDSVRPKNCPRCTYGPHAKMFEQAIAVDHTTVNFA